MCQKKYCECYQANVGCSDGCRCEGCKNIYGIRKDYLAREVRELMIKRTSLEMSEETMVNSNLVSSRVHSSPKLTPITPALQCSDQRKNVLQSRQPFRRYLRIADSHHDNILSSGVNFSPRNSQGVQLETLQNIDIGALDTKAVSKNTDEKLVPESDESIFAPSSFQSLKTMANNSNLRKNIEPQPFAEIGPIPSSNFLRWRSSPITPITELASSMLKDIDTDVKFLDMLEEETPEILKQSSSLVKSVTVNSPNKKRISPPYNHIISSESLSSRKFVLRAVPSFPSLKPCSKDSRSDDKDQSSN